MSANVLKQPYKDQYINVYQKGSLIGMCLDVIIREKSNGERGILDLMQKLSSEYGVSKAFNDDELFAKITALTYPEVGEFLTTYVSGSTPIPYATYFAKVGVTKTTEKVPGNVFLKGKSPYITVNQQTKEIIVIPNIELNTFYTSLGIKGGDIVMAINDKTYTLDNIYEMIGESQKWKENDIISLKIKRDGAVQTLKGKVKLPYEEKEALKASDATKKTLKEAWLKS
jgi:predicted metalloprotease with PDZ domain